MPEDTAKKTKLGRSTSDANGNQGIVMRDKSKKSSSKSAQRRTTDGTSEADNQTDLHRSLNDRSSADSSKASKHRTSVNAHTNSKVRDSVESSNGGDADAIIDEENEPVDLEHQRVEKIRLKTRGSFIDRLKSAWRSSTTSLKRSGSQNRLSFSNLFGSSRKHRGSVTSLRNADPENVTDVGNLVGYGESDVFRCAVSMLDGQSRQFRLDKRECVGSELLSSVAAYLNLAEKEYFGLIYFDKRQVWHWLILDKKVSAQLDGMVPFLEFQCRFYPIDPRNDMKEDLSRYYLALQVRQDILSGKLPCSFLTLAILGAYAAQADLGDQADFEPALQNGSHRTDNDSEQQKSRIASGDYLKDYPLAPSSMQTEQLLEKTADLHRSMRGMLPEQCDLAFLDEARKLALYGMDLHRARDERGVEMLLGVNGHGIVVYRDRVRVHTYTWPRILKVSYRRTTVTVSLRADQFGYAGGWRSVDSRADLSAILGPSTSIGRRHDPSLPFDETYKLRSYKLAKRCWRTVVEQHGFFRMRVPELPPPPKRPLFKRLATSMRDLTGSYSGTTQAQLRDREPSREAPNVRRSSSIRHSGGALGSWASLTSLRRSQSLLLQPQSAAKTTTTATATTTATTSPETTEKQTKATPKLPPRRTELSNAADDEDLEKIGKAQTERAAMAAPSAAEAEKFHAETTVQVPPKAKQRRSKLPPPPPAVEEPASDSLSPDKYHELEARLFSQLNDRHEAIKLHEKDQVERSEFLLIKQKSTAKVVYVDDDGEPIDPLEADQLPPDDDDELL